MIDYVSDVVGSGIVDGNWGPWSLMTACSTTCGPGNKTRTRTCTNPAPAGGGNECVGTNHEVKACNVLTCPGESVLLTCPGESLSLSC